MMEVLMRRSREGLCTARSILRHQIHVLPEGQREVLSTPLSIQRTGRLPGLRDPAPSDRRQLHVMPEGRRIWVPESFNGTSATGINGERFYVDKEVEIPVDYFKRSPLLHAVPKDRLFNPSLHYPYFTMDDGNLFVLSGLDLIDKMHGCGLSTKGLFVKENVVLLPRSMAFGFKEVNVEGIGGANNLPIQDRVDNYLQFMLFLEQLIEQSQGALPKELLPPFLKGIMELAPRMLTEETIVEVLRCYPDLMPLDSKRVYYQRVFNIMAQRLPLLMGTKLPVAGFVPGTSSVADLRSLCQTLLTLVPYTSSGNLWGNIARRNFEVFNLFSSSKAMTLSDPLGLIRTLRVMSAHPFEWKMLNLMRELGQVESDVNAGRWLTWRAQSLSGRALSSSLQRVPPTCSELMRLADGTFPDYPSGIALGFWECRVYSWLDIPSLMRR